MNTLGLWQQCVSLCYWTLRSCKYDCNDALANEAHNEVCQQLIEDEGVKGGGLGQGSRSVCVCVCVCNWSEPGLMGEEVRESSQKMEEWNPNLTMMGGEKRRRPAAIKAGSLLGKCWHF